MKSSRPEWVIHFSADDYWLSNTAVRHHICQALHDAGCRILWVNSVGFRMPSRKGRGLAGKILRKLASVAKSLRRVRPGWYVVTPLQLPVFRRSRLAAVNRWMLRAQMWMCRVLLGIRNPVVLHTTPTFADSLGFLRARRCVYYYSDQYTLHRDLSDAERNRMEEQDRRLQGAADAIICGSRMIFEHVASQAGPQRTFYFPHRVDFQRFHKVDRTQLPADLAAIPRPRIGYYGSLSDSNDWAVIRHCAEQRPGYQFVFIGRKDIARAGVEHLANVHFLGKKPFDLIPHYGAGFDVGIMFWVRREWIKHCSPLKLKEYLALGLPVVSTRIEEVETDYAGIVYTADSAAEFLARLDDAVAGDNAGRIRRGLERVSGDTWNAIVPLIVGE